MNLLDNIETVLGRGESVQIVGLPNMGKTRLAHQIPGLHIDTHLLPPQPSLSEFISLICVSADLPPPADLPQLFSGLAQKLNRPPQTIIINHLDQLLLPTLTPVFNLFKSLRDKYKYRLKFVFFVNGAMPISSTHGKLLGDLFPIVCENILYHPPLPLSDLSQIIETDFSPDIGFHPNGAQVRQIAHLSGGIPGLVKICLQCLRDNITINPENLPGLKYQLQETHESLGENPTRELLILHGLVDKNGRYFSQLLSDYIENASSSHLSASESRLLDYFRSRSGELVTKDQICQTVYPDVKNSSGITDHAIDQLVHRLRGKVANQYTITTRRGQGYILSL